MSWHLFEMGFNFSISGRDNGNLEARDRELGSFVQLKLDDLGLGCRWSCLDWLCRPSSF